VGGVTVGLMSLGITCTLYAASQSVWASVVSMAVCLCMYMCENCSLRRDITLHEQRETELVQYVSTLKQSLLDAMDRTTKLERQLEFKLTVAEWSSMTRQGTPRRRTRSWTSHDCDPGSELTRAQPSQTRTARAQHSNTL
jgi:hypothetical protein